MTANRLLTRFGLIRHAKTVWNQEKRIQGQQDTPITLEGEKQAREWGRRLQPFGCKRILASTAGRALKTAELVNENLQLPLCSDSRLSEQDWGLWTGKTVAELKQKAPRLLAEQEARGWEFCPPGGEDRNKVWIRSKTALEESAMRWPGTTILVLTHDGVIKSLIYRLCGRKFLPPEPALVQPYHLHWLIYDKKGLQLEKVNAIAL